MPETSANDLYFPHRINRKSTAIPVKIGSVNLGEIPVSELEGGYAQPNPIKISWSRTNIVKVHEIPYPIHKTVRTSKKTLYKMTMQLKTLKTEIFDKLLKVSIGNIRLSHDRACGKTFIIFLV